MSVSNLFLDSSFPAPEGRRVLFAHDQTVAQLLVEILTELRRANSTTREGAVSSVLIEDNPTKDRIVRISTKTYAGSVVDADEALRVHGYLHRRAEELALNGWRETVDALRANGGAA
jgi:hypothetical protein